MKDYYTVLGVSPNDDTETIRKSYRKLAKRYHPDLNPGNHEAEVKCREINEAWETLGDVTRREKYDSSLNKQAGAQKKTQKSSAPVSDVDLEHLMGQFDAFFGKGAQQVSQKAANPLDASGLFDAFMGIKK